MEEGQLDVARLSSRAKDHVFRGESIKLFKQRMARERREVELRELAKAIWKQFKPEAVSYSNAEKWAMVEMGYESLEREKEHLAEYMELQQKMQEAGGTVSPSFEDALRQLPPVAALQDELDWVRAHPAMLRKRLLTDSSATVTVTVEDVLNPMNGRAPSVSAVNLLCNWVDRPEKFQEKLFSQYNKATKNDDEKGREKEQDVGLDEVQGLLDSLNS